METAWIFRTLAVTAAEIDFLDPALRGDPGARERGVRLELRPVDGSPVGSVYASPTVTLRPTVCRIDLLESAPGAADRMHWHPVMDRGEPGDRVFDPAIPADPPAWLAARLQQVGELLDGDGVLDAGAREQDVDAVARASADIVAWVEAALVRVRRPWPEASHDARGMAPT
jgi:hypothetical protein